ncbi:unnamed protein product, partial [Mesorhabditis belari]|uniref:FYVE-type domain-containing protein n=1 Tax=Mesorhabditis belari TaxID=2138241 RepID=A0AAF3J739_9BILA
MSIDENWIQKIALHSPRRMSAQINSRPSSSNSGTNEELAKPELLAKLDDHVARVTDGWVLANEDGLWTASEDKSVRLYLRRDNDQYWPSINHFMPVQPTCLFYCEEVHRLLVGLLNGHVFVYDVADDCNSLRQRQHFTLHAGPISGLYLSITSELIFSSSRDKTVLWHCSENGTRQGGASIDSSCVCMVVAQPFIFIGDYGGNVHVLRIDGSVAQHLHKLSAHTGTVTSLAWDNDRQWLFSGSADNLVIIWDIGGRKGEAYELTGHKSRITKLYYGAGKKQLFSADESGKLMIWDMSAARIVTPAWATSDTCQLCEAPFFWNLQAMWQKKVVGQRQHHCRICGRAVCGSCCSARTTYPPMGFEIPVRICKSCDENMKNHSERYNLTPLAVGHDIRTGVVGLHVQELNGRMVIVGQNRSILLYNIKNQ